MKMLVKTKRSRSRSGCRSLLGTKLSGGVFIQALLGRFSSRCRTDELSEGFYFLPPQPQPLEAVHLHEEPQEHLRQKKNERAHIQTQQNKIRIWL